MKHGARAIAPMIAGIVMSMLSEVSHAESHAMDYPTLALIGAIEAPKGYNSISSFAKTRPPRPIVDMTIGEILAWQEREKSLGAQSTAVGRYQFISGTLEWVTRRYGISHDRVFRPALQRDLARLLLAKCGFYDRGMDVDPLADCLAKSWAALPVVTGPDTGRSYYAGLAGNKARITPAAIKAVLAIRFTPDAFVIQPRVIDEAVQVVEARP